MARFSSEEVELLLQIARDARSGDSFRARFEAISDALSALVPFCDVSAFVVDPRGQGGPDSGKVIFRDRDASALAAYAQHYRHVDPMGITFAEGKGRPYLLSDFTHGGRYGKDAFTGEMLPALGIRHIMAFGHTLPSGEMFAFAIHRERGLRDYSEHEREIVRLASPDIGRAIQAVLLQEQVARLEAGPGGAAARSGALVFDGQGELLHADRGAAALAARIEDPRGPAWDLLADDVRRLLGLGAQGTVDAESVYRLQDGWLRVRYSLSVRHGRQAIIALLEALTPGTADYFEAVAGQAHLTPREREVAALVVQGLGNRQIGQRLGLSAVTVGVHLTQVYRKTNTCGRHDLITLLLGNPEPPR